MASPRRIAANRRNAARSTGPVTTTGKMRASRNALKHGFNVSVRHDPASSDKLEVLAEAIAGKNPTARRLRAALDVAEAQLELKRVQEYRLALIESEQIEIGAALRGAPKDDPEDEDIAAQEYALAYARALPILTKLERYERRARTRIEETLRSFGIVTEE
jgi:hypothetical protein